MSQIKRYRGDDWDDIYFNAYAPHPVTGVIGPITNLDQFELSSSLVKELGGSVIWTGTSTGGEVEVIDGPTGRVSVFVPKAITATLTKGIHRLDLQIKSGTGRIKTLAMDEIVVEMDISPAT